MDKVLYKKKNELIDKQYNLSIIVSSLENFFNENEKNFKRDESIATLKSIKNYLIEKKTELNDVKKDLIILQRKLIQNCNHEIAIKRSNIYNYQCLICNCSLGANIPQNSLISINTTKDYKVTSVIENIFKDIVYSDKDLIKTISYAVEEIQYESEIKVYRRSR